MYSYCILLYSLQAVLLCAALHISDEFDTVCEVNYSLLLRDVGNRVSVVSTITGLWGERSGVQFPKEGKLFCKTSRPSVGSTRPYLLDAGSSFARRSAEVKNVYSYCSAPLCASMVRTDKTFTFHLFVIRCYKRVFIQLSQHCENYVFQCVYVCQN